ncbi:MAG TPA: hypothetical protein VGR02_05635 [Thermoanaerobaculia bacterium]|jgi:hypothetical protein|nr:hypothetical protein [Thermoanaerobaculia bacterium]
MERLDAFLRPLYQDLDGVSRLDEAERVARIARRLAPPSRELELLLRFQVLGSWLEKVGNLSRVVLTVPEVSESELRRVAASIRRLDAPATEVERAVAAAVLIDGAGVRGLAERFGRARREGSSPLDVAREEEPPIPTWMSDDARAMLLERRAKRAAFCQAILDET